jgi:hypothetical protein
VPTPYLAAVRQAASTGTSTPVTITHDIAIGDTIVALTACSGAANTTGITDSAGNNWLPGPSNSGTQHGSMWYCLSSVAAMTVAGSSTITVAKNTSAGNDEWIIGGCAGLALKDVSPASTSGSSAAPSVTSGTLSQSDEIAFGGVSNGNGGGSPTQTGAFAQLGQGHVGSAQWATLAWAETASATSFNYAPTIVSTTWSAFLLTFTVAAISKSTIDAGSSAEIYAISATIPEADAGAGTDTYSVAASISKTDSGAGADSYAVAAAAATADAGSSAESYSVSAAIPVTDAGSSAESYSVAAVIPVADAGSAAEAYSVTAAAVVTEAGSGTEAYSVSASIPAAPDSGTGSDSFSAAVTATMTDGGTSGDSFLASRTAAVGEAGSGADSFTVSVAVPLAETGAASEAFSVAASTALTDAGTGTDIWTPVVQIGSAEGGSAMEAWGVSAGISLAEAGAGADSFSVSRSLPEGPFSAIMVSGVITALDLTPWITVFDITPAFFAEV